MSTYAQNQPPQVLHDIPSTGTDYVAPTPLPPPPEVVGQPVKDGYELSDKNNNPPDHGTQSRGDGFWRGCCAGMCCCCLLDICF
ncbi:protein CYSTEINE-RICH TRANSMEMBRANE MODULE 6-like isoform X2 [Bidens hawaiensis]|uniref:protein CYSTEINE-RICH TRANSMEMBRANE MODULE 6-like isoform X2 n=1 Tax=Bidens hawaiensis TaxID=980011 RepID=UPI00404B7AEE